MTTLLREINHWAVWADGHMAPWNTLDREIGQGRSDDVFRVQVTSYDDDGPSNWLPVLREPSPRHPNLHYRVCPVCAGTGRELLDEAGLKAWRGTATGFNEASRSKNCGNCGGQTMSGTPTGWTPPSKADPTKGCHHTFSSSPGGRCYTIWTCTLGCGTSFGIDSGD